MAKKSKISAIMDCANYDGLHAAAKLLPKEIRNDFITAFMLTDYPDLHNGDLSAYMKGILSYLGATITVVNKLKSAIQTFTDSLEEFDEQKRRR